MSLEYAFKESTGDLYPGVLRGYRCWRVTPNGRLMACNFDTEWDTGLNVGDCRYSTGDLGHGGRPRHDPGEFPKRGCTCGFYATYDDSFPTGSSWGAWGAARAAHRPDSLSGSIKASGRVILGTKGFRAEKAQVEALVVPYSDKSSPVALVAEHIAAVYGVPTFKSFAALMEAFPPVDVEALVGPLPPPWVLWANGIFNAEWKLSEDDMKRLFEWSRENNGGNTIEAVMTADFDRDTRGIMLRNPRGALLPVTMGQPIDWDLERKPPPRWGD